MNNKEEQQYLDILSDLLENGVDKEDRTGTGTKTLFCRSMRFDLSKSFPLLTTKRVYFKGVVTELIWFLSGSTNIKYLVDNDVHIWDEWPYKEYCKKQSNQKQLITQQEFIQKIKDCDAFAKKWGSIGDGGYGAQWRNFGFAEEWTSSDCLGGGWDHVILQKGFDQITWLVNEIKTNPDSRRLLVWAFNPKDHNELKKAVLPPCHMGFQVVILGNKLNLVWTQRSVDTTLGLPFNIASYAVLAHILALETGYEVGELVFEGHDVHLYKNHIEPAKLQLSRETFDFPQIKINKRDSVFDYTINDFELVDYKCHPGIKMPIAV